MDHISDDAGHIASDYVDKHGRDALIYLDGDIAKALGTQRWDDYKLLHRARIRLLRVQLFEQRSGARGGTGLPRLVGHS